MPAPRRTAADLQQAKLIADLQRDNERMRQQLAQPEPNFVPIKCAEARGFSTETVRRWCHRGLVLHRWDGTRLLVDQTDLTARCDRLLNR